ncbi:hypothetical protein [Pseudomonas sp. JG-B]|uniref:hypothetical protein n=1 Tax=Pseudomonas sp. JG-B TaxID=2603214 RepID=UPI00129E3D96|nr:hypothetical protein [Pseudomonas sp. JG-B]MRK21951.1 hypothetical protein [Pseudomonas sp. JG-B]
MRQYQGAVFFVDLLGIGALTRKKVPLEKLDYDAWALRPASRRTEHVFCAKLLTTFRTCLRKVQKRYGTLKIAQLSDCAFLWSTDASLVAKGASDLMWFSTTSGLLCRGGIASGEIVEPDRVDRTLGAFVLGEAATKAVGLEQAGKGCRIFCDDGLVTHLSSEDGSEFGSEVFGLLKNPMDCSIVDEFKWYLKTGPSQMTLDDREALMLEILELTSLLRHSPRFNWNSTSHEGRVHLACSIESISLATQLFTNCESFVFNSECMINGFGARSNLVHGKVSSIWKDEARSRFAHVNKRRNSGNR